MIFWADIIKWGDAGSYADAVLASDTKEILSDLARQNFYISSVLDRKYFWLKLCFLSLISAVLILLLSRVV